MVPSVLACHPGILQSCLSLPAPAGAHVFRRTNDGPQGILHRAWPATEMNRHAALTAGLATLLSLLLASSQAPFVGGPQTQPRFRARQVETESKPSRLLFSDYRVLFDRNPDGYAASGGTFLFQDHTLFMAFQKASDGDSGTQTSLSSSPDMGKSWSDPIPFGPSVRDPKTAFQ